MPRGSRVVCAFLVHFSRLGERVSGVSEDISRKGIFVRTEELLPVGEIVELTIQRPDDEPLAIVSRVSHVLSGAAARALGRSPGLGFEFLERDSERRALLTDLVEELLDTLTPIPGDLPVAIRILVAERYAGMRDRIAETLRASGFDVTTVAGGGEIVAECLARRPDVIVASDGLPGLDGRALLRILASHARLADLPVVLVSQAVSEMSRLDAYRAGVADFIQTPFTDDELAIRLWRVVRSARSLDPRGTLRGDLGTINLGTLLSLLEFESKSGILILLIGPEIARLFVAGGRVVKVEASLPGETAVDKLMQLLGATGGNFEFAPCEVVGDDEVGLPTTGLLLEHARKTDERRAASR